MLQHSFSPRRAVVPRRLSRRVTRELEGLAEVRRAVEARDGRAFTAAMHRIDWSRASGDDYVAAVRLLIEAEAIELARRLADEGAERFPRHEQLRRAAYVLAPPRVISVGGPRATGLDENVAWIPSNAACHAGRWVAVRNGGLLDSAPTYEELRQRVEPSRDTLFARL